MSWTVEFLPEALKDWKSLSGNQAVMVGRAIDRVQNNPLPVSEGGYGKPLGNKNGRNLSGMLTMQKILTMDSFITMEVITST